MPKLNMVEALNLALAEEMARDSQIILLGEDVGRLGGVFRVTDGLQARFGPDRVIDTPLAESAIVGTSLGLAVGGLKPVAELQFMGFLYPALDQIISHISRYRNRTRGRLPLPLVIRMPYGGGIHALNLPRDPVGQRWTSTLLSTTVSSPPQGEDLALGDIDRDGDLDILLGEKWLRNDGKEWPTFVLGKVTQGEPDRCRLADVNGSGRLDAVVSLENGTDILWFEAPADPTQPWKRHNIGSVAGQGFSMDVADFNLDGRPDVVVGEHRGKEVNRVIIFEDLDKGASWAMHVIDSGPKGQIDHHDGVQAFDMDGDGDLDIISIGWYNPKLWIFENAAID